MYPKAIDKGYFSIVPQFLYVLNILVRRNLYLPLYSNVFTEF